MKIIVNNMETDSRLVETIISSVARLAAKKLNIILINVILKYFI